MQSNRAQSFGIYTLANDRVLNQLVCLHNSLKIFSSRTPLTVIAFDEQISETKKFCEQNRLELITEGLEVFDEIGSRVSTGREQGFHIYRKFRAFQGSYATFLFLDADCLVLGDVSDLPNILKESKCDFLFYAYSAPSRNFLTDELRNLSKSINAFGKDGFNAAFILSRCNSIPVDALFAISNFGSRIQKQLLHGHEQAFLNYMIVFCGLTADLVRNFSKRYRAPWDIDRPIQQINDRYFYDQEADLIVFHWGGALWGLGTNKNILQRFTKVEQIGQ